MKNTKFRHLRQAFRDSNLERFSEKINELFWLNPYYLIFNSGEQIKIIETDEKDRINSISIGEFKNPEIFWDAKSKLLFILSGENLYKAEQIIQ